MRKLLAFVATAVVLSGCVADIGPEDRDFDEPVESSGEALDNAPGDDLNGTACCAKDYRDGNGDTMVCGKRNYGFCCNEEKTECYNCSYYECEPPPEAEPPAKKFPIPIVKPPSGGFEIAP